MWCEDHADRDRSCNGECNGGEEAEDILDADKRGVHGGVRVVGGWVKVGGSVDRWASGEVRRSIEQEYILRLCGNLYAFGHLVNLKQYRED